MKKSFSKRSVAEYLELWFAQNQNNKQIWSKDSIGIIIKANLIRTGNWKKASSNCGKNNNSLGNLGKKPSKIEDFGDADFSGNDLNLF
jgi:hypothetical protein